MKNQYLLFIAIGAVILAAAIGVFYLTQPQASPTPAASPTPTMNALATATPTPVQQQTASPTTSAKTRNLPFTWASAQAQSCEGLEKHNVYFFEDPYSYITAVSNGETVPVDRFVGFFEQKFAGAVEITHKILPVRSQKMIGWHDEKKIGYVNERYSKENVELAQKYFVCAQIQKKLSEFKKCFYDSILTVQFSDGNSDFLPMNKTELDSCATMLNPSQLAACMPNAAAAIANDAGDAQRLGITTLPTAAIDCKYKGHSVYIENALCFYFPSVQGC